MTGRQRGRRPIEESGPGGDDLRRRDDLHRPDDRVHRRPKSSGNWAYQHRHAMGVNAYLLSLAALFALGGRLGDTWATARWWSLGVVTFAGASAMCGLTPKGSVAEAWIVAFRVDPGRRWGDHVPARVGDRGADVCAARAGRRWPFFRYSRWPDRDRPRPRRLPDRVDLAGHLLGEHPGGDHRPGADRHLQANHESTNPRGWTIGAPS